MTDSTHEALRADLGASYDIPVRMFGTVDDSIVDGPGLRFGVFMQGCSHACPGCHNKESWDACGGYADTVGHVCELIAASKSVSGVTLSGGEPFEQPDAALAIARWCKRRGLSVWVYSGYTYEAIARGDLGPAAVSLLDECDVLVDGPFVQKLFSHELKWRGSSNQRVIDLLQTRSLGRVVLCQPKEVESKTPDLISFQIPESW